MADLIAGVEAEYQAEWDYYTPEKPPGIVGPVEIECGNSGAVGFGTLLRCRATPLEDREYWPDPFPITLLVAGEDGTVRDVIDRDEPAAYELMAPGGLCRDVVRMDGGLSSYFDSVAYWFLEGRPDRMDADGNGVPCETVFPLSEVASFWHGSRLEEATGIHFGSITDVARSDSGYELTIDYALFLQGMEANLAAEAAGEIQPGEGVPNDYHIVNDNPRLREFSLAAGVEPLLLGYREGIESIAVDPAAWIELIAESARCEAAGWPEDCAALGGDDWSWFGGGQLPYWIKLNGDEIVRIEEQYLP